MSNQTKGLAHIETRYILRISRRYFYQSKNYSEKCKHAHKGWKRNQRIDEWSGAMCCVAHVMSSNQICTWDLSRSNIFPHLLSSQAAAFSSVDLIAFKFKIEIRRKAKYFFSNIRPVRRVIWNEMTKTDEKSWFG